MWWLYLSIACGIASFFVVALPNLARTDRAAVEVAFRRFRVCTISSKLIKSLGFAVACSYKIVVNKNRTRLLSFHAVSSTRLSIVGPCQSDSYFEVYWLDCSAFFFATKSLQIPEFVLAVPAAP
jgi:hypothetical protein